MKIPLLSWIFLLPICTLFFSFGIFVVSGQCLHDQQDLLIELKNSLIFNSTLSTKLVRWNESADCCSWEGVTCSDVGRVIGVNLDRESISGGLDNSSSLFRLQYLQNLSLANNNFNSSRIPPEFGNLTKLSYLDLSNAGFAGQIPIEISRLTRLVILDLSVFEYFMDFDQPKLKLENPDLATLVQNLTWLTELYLDAVNISAQRNDWCQALSSSLPNLRVLSMSGCYLSGPLHSSLQKFQSLSIIHLDYNDLSAAVPVSLFSLPLLRTLTLSNNRFSGQIHEFSNVSSFQLNTLDLSNNYLEGPIPMSLFELRGLQELVLYSNNFSGSLHPNAIQQLGNLSYLDLSYNNLLIECNGANSSLSFLPLLEILYLTSIKLKTFPDFLRNQTNLIELDLSNNQIHGEIPNWMWKLTHLDYLNISYNNVEGTFPNLSSLHILDLRSNQFHGQLPTFLQPFGYLDLSWNNFSSVIPASSFISIYSLSLSSNKFHGHIPESICNATFLKFLDLSNNSLSGTIPQCLFAMSSIGVLKLKKNNLIGKISDTFPAYCPLVALNLNGNLLEGVVPKSLANCTYLEILDIGNNQIQDAFPCYLKYISTLRILILRSNKFYGSIGCGGPNATWLLLQIVDLASNNFSGKLSIKSFANSKAMVVDNKAQSEFNYLQYQNSPIHTHNYLNQRETSFLNLYLDAITVSSKGLYFELRKIWYRFTSIDLSCNNLNGPIPEDIEVLKSLYILNLSHNAFTDRIPPSLGKLSELESLDLSSNKLTGEIPMQLADGLIFLSVLNLSFNQLIGPIPYIKQFATFSEASYEGNKGLYGCPSKKECTSIEPRSPPPIFEDSHSKSGHLIDWNYIAAELGFVFGFGLVIGPLMFWKKWRIQYYKHVDDIFFKIFPQLYLWGEKYCRIRANRNGVHRH